MSKNFDKIKKYYDSGLWSKERVRNVTNKGFITADEYEMIVGKEKTLSN